MTGTTSGSGKEVRAGLPPRRQYTVEFKRRAVEDTFAPGVSVAIVARRHDINSNQLFTWRRQYYRGEFGEIRRIRSPAVDFIPVGVVSQSGADTPQAAMKALPLPAPAVTRSSGTRRAATAGALSERKLRAGVIALKLTNGMELTLSADVDVAWLRQVLLALREVA
jgi:transposase